jgi:hypothetical protein
MKLFAPLKNAIWVSSLKISYLQNMKKIILLFSICITISCSKSSDPTPASTGKAFTVKIGTIDYATDDVTFLSGGGTLAGISKDTKGSFSIAVFAKDFPLGKAINVAYSPSISFLDDKKVTYITKSGTMTFSALDATKMTGTFALVMVSGTKELTMTEGKFNIVSK